VGDISQEQPRARSASEVEELLLSSEDLVGRVVGHLKNSGIRGDRDEMEAYARQGLVEAAQRFDASVGSDFRRFAYFRARGSVLDGMRKMGDWGRRGYERVVLLRACNEVSAAQSEEVSELKAQKASEADGILRRHMAAMATAMTAGVFADHTIVAGGEVVALDDKQTAEDLLGDMQMSSVVRAAIKELPPPEDEVVRRFYVEGEKMDIIAHDMGRSKSWVSRVHTKALKRLGARLRAEAF
jgi:RNA polymerase sigma factor for flagellar operon FliA